jgi:hypothetical protein
MSKVVKDIYERAKASRESDGAACIASKDVAKLVKVAVTAKFPGVKFSVKSDYNSISVSWTDGPAQRVVQSVISQYSFGGFDGSIDLAYSNKNWLLPDGSMVPASSEGTVGSRGYVPSFTTDCPKPGAVLVKFGPSYVNGARHISDERMAELCGAVAKHYGYEIKSDIPLHNQLLHGEYLTSLARRYEAELAVSHK